MPQKDLTTIGQLESASRGDAPYDADPPATCYFLHDGTYVQNGGTLAMYIKVGGADATHRRVFVGQSRDGVVIRGRATIDAGVSHVQVTNLTFTLTGYAQTGSFNTFSMLAGSVDLRLDHLTFTGDCATGANGGHVEIDGSTDVAIDSCLIEKFGRCGPAGHQDHGVYLASGSRFSVTNNLIRGNASRGIQFNTQGGTFGTIDQVTIERNLIVDNGHGDYEDGIVMNATGTGTISNVTVQHNVFTNNYYSGMRWVGDQYASIVVQKNTFFRNGTGSTKATRSEVNLDSSSGGDGAHTTITKNLFVPATAVLNDCYDSAPRGFLLSDDLVQGTLPTGACVTTLGAIADPMFVNSTGLDFHPQAAAAKGYGAYAP